MDQKKIDRINELAHKSKAEGLTDAEKAEQTAHKAKFSPLITPYHPRMRMEKSVSTEGQEIIRVIMN